MLGLFAARARFIQLPDAGLGHHLILPPPFETYYLFSVYPPRPDYKRPRRGITSSMRIGTLKRLASVGLLIAGGFYMLLIDTSSQPELWAGLGAWILAAIAYEISREQGLVEARIRLTWLLRSWRVAIRVPVHVALVSRDAVAQLLAPRSRRGRFRAVPFGAGGDEPVDAGRRALAEALGSLTPNTIVIGIDTESKLLLVHQLHPQGGREELDPLGLG
jgi:hypothetical protein